MNIAIVILWYLIGYVGCVWAVSREFDVTMDDLLIFVLLAIGGPVTLVLFVLLTADSGKVMIRRRK